MCNDGVALGLFLAEMKAGLARIETQLREHMHALKSIARTEQSQGVALAKLQTQGEEIMVQIDDVVTSLESLPTVLDGMDALLKSLKDQLAAQGLDQAKVDKAFALAEANKKRIVDALLANTPNAPPTP